MIRLEKPIFIIGCTNSGTKCLFWSLMAHKSLGGLRNELHYYGFQPNVEGRLNRLFSLWPCFVTNYLDSPKMRSMDSGPTDPMLVRTIMQNILKNEREDILPGDRLLIKEPKLSLRIKWLREVFPDCYIIAIVRNPWSVVEGIKRKLYAMGDLPLYVDTPTAAAQWNITNHIIQLESKGLDNFQLVRYEDMINASCFPMELESNCFWSRLLHHAGLSQEKFRIPNESKYSHFEKDKDQSSADKLEEWDIDYIDEACQALIKHFNYTKPVKKNNE